MVVNSPWGSACVSSSMTNHAPRPITLSAAWRRGLDRPRHLTAPCTGPGRGQRTSCEHTRERWPSPGRSSRSATASRLERRLASRGGGRDSSPLGPGGSPGRRRPCHPDSGDGSGDGRAVMAPALVGDWHRAGRDLGRRPLHRGLSRRVRDLRHVGPPGFLHLSVYRNSTQCVDAEEVGRGRPGPWATARAPGHAEVIDIPVVPREPINGWSWAECSYPPLSLLRWRITDTLRE
jgi:hypothetical protein